MVPVDDGEVEAATLLEEVRQRVLRGPWVEFDQLGESRLVEELEPDVAEARALVRVERDVPRLLRRAGEKTCAGMERCDSVPQPDLDRSRRLLSRDPAPQRLASSGVTATGKTW